MRRLVVWNLVTLDKLLEARPLESGCVILRYDPNALKKV